MKAVAIAAALFVAIVAMFAIPVGIGFVVGYVKESRSVPPAVTGIRYCTPDSTDPICVSALARRRSDGGLGAAVPVDVPRH
jgi:hypothetical protein